MSSKISEGAFHQIPKDLKKLILEDFSAYTTWENITPIARNEWICWVQNAKKQETGDKRIKRTQNELKEGKRRPCCWPGCPHRKKQQST